MSLLLTFFVKKATKDFDYLVVASLSDVWFQDNKFGKIIGERSAKNGLYVLDDLKCATTPSTLSPAYFNFIWHTCLSHFHFNDLCLLLPKTNMDHKDCEPYSLETL